jgi:hypothetical protein
MLHERFPLACGNRRHAVGDGIVLLFEEDRQVVLTDVAEPNGRGRRPRTRWLGHRPTLPVTPSVTQSAHRERWGDYDGRIQSEAPRWELA